MSFFNPFIDAFKAIGGHPPPSPNVVSLADEVSQRRAAAAGGGDFSGTMKPTDDKSQPAPQPEGVIAAPQGGKALFGS